MPDLQTSVLNVFYEIGICKIPDLSAFVYEDVDFFAITLYDSYYIEIDQSLDMMFKTAKVVLPDRSGFRENYPLTGNEIITIRYRNSGDIGGDEKIIHFRIFSVDEIPNIKEQTNKNSMLISLNLVEFPVFDFLMDNKVYLSYEWGENNINGSTSIEKIIEDTLNAVPNLLNWYDIEIDPTLKSQDDLFNFFVPNWTPMKVIKYLSKYAIKESNRNQGLYTFTTDHSTGEGIRPKLVFKSVYSYLEEDVARNYGSLHESVFGSDGDDVEGYAEEFEYAPTEYIKNKRIEFSDSSKQIFSRLSGSTVSTFSYINDNKYLAFNYSDFLSSYNSFLGTLGVHGVNYGNQWSDFSYSPLTNESQIKSLYVNKYSNKTMKSVSCTIQTHVNQLRKVGEKVELDLKSNSETGKDEMMGKSWLTWSIKDVILQSGEGSSQVIFYKDSFEDVRGDPGNLPDISSEVDIL